MQKKKVLPIGKDDFRKIRSTQWNDEHKTASYYVDKTLLIKEFLSRGEEVTLITRPRRFGKTLAMTMLRDFLDITQDSKSIFEGLAIMETEYSDAMNTTPLISISLKGCTGEDASELMAAIADVMKKEYTKHAKLFKDIDQDNFVYFQFLKTLEELKNGNINRISLQNSLSDLLSTLHEFYGVRPILLLDEYDNPIIEAQKAGFKDEFMNFYGSFLTHALKGNTHLGKAMLTGIQRVAKESVFSKLNNLVVYTVLSKPYAEYFGFTEFETKVLLEYYDLELTPEVKARYDGYIFGGLEMYNNWSILAYANEKELRNYWLNTSTNALVKQSVLKADASFQRDFEELIRFGEVEVNMNLEASFMELERTDTLWGLFVNAGYITVVRSDYDLNVHTVRIPNKEITTEFKEIVGAYTKLSSQTLTDMLISLTRGQIDKFFDAYRFLVLDATSYHDSKENAYHMLLLGMMMNLRELYDIKSNLESGHGRSDIIMKSKREGHPHIIIEFKYGEDIEKLKQEALDQILKQEYYASLTGEVICIGLAHNKKRCELVHQRIVV